MTTHVNAVPVALMVELSVEDRLAMLEAEVKKLQPETPETSIGNSHVGIIRRFGAYLVGVPKRAMLALGRGARAFWIWFW